MKQHTNEDIVSECERIWKDSFGRYRDGKIEVEINTPDKVVIVISQMYAYVKLNLTHLLMLAEFFGTKNINDSRYSSCGCETCDYGSSYEITLTIRPEPK